MKFNRKATVCLVLVACLLSMVGCAGAPAPAAAPAADSAAAAEDTSPIRIGLDAPMTGTNASFGEQLSLGAKMAVDELNAKGGVRGRQLELEIQDDKSDPKEAATIATRWVADDTIVASLGYYNSSCCLAALPIINEGKLPSIFTGSNPDISNQNKTYGFRTEPSDNQQAVYAGEWMLEDGCKNVAILYESTDYGMGQEKIITELIENNGGKVVCSEAYILGETKDFTNVLTKVKNSGADSLFIAGVYAEGALICKQQRTLGMDLPVYSSSSMFEVAFLEAAGEASEGVKVQGVLVPDDPSEVVVNFETAYKKLYGEDKTAGTFSAHGYNAVMMIAEAVENVGTDPDAMAEYIANTTFETVYGVVKFNETHDLVFDKLTRLVGKGGQFVVVD